MKQEGKANIDILLQYGDCILLQSKNGYLQSQGFTKPGLFLQLGNLDDTLCFRNFRDFVFMIRPRLRYEAFKEYNAFKIKHEGTQSQKQSMSNILGNDNKDHGGAADEFRMIQLTKKLEEELKENKSILKRRIGEQVEYGSEVELVHFDSGGMLEASKTVAEFDKQSNLLKLVEQGSKAVCYYIEPRYKYRSIGQKVTYGDVISFRNIKTDLYIHISERQAIWDNNRKTIYDDSHHFKNVVNQNIDFRMPPNMYAPSYEINCSSAKSKFTLLPFRNFESQCDTASIKGGQVIRLQHSETGAYVSSDDQDFTNDGLAEVFLWNYKGKSNDIESTTTNSLFELEIVQEGEDSNMGQYAEYSGNIQNPISATHGGMLFRLRHLNTGRLVVSQDFSYHGQTIKTVGLSEHYPVNVKLSHEEGKIDKVELPIDRYQRIDIDNQAQDSLFRLVSTGVDIDNRIRCATSVQIQHVGSKGFLILDSAKFKVNTPQTDEKKQTSEDLDPLSAKDIRDHAIQVKGQTRSAVQRILTKTLLGNQDDDTSVLFQSQITMSPDKRGMGMSEFGSPERQQTNMSRQMTDHQMQVFEQINHLGHQEEMIDKELYIPESDDNLNQGTREVLSFQKTPSFENAFFIYPEGESSLMSVLQVHVSVNLMNSFLPEIASPDLGTSKERVKKIESVLIELSNWLEEEKDFIAKDEQELMEAPYSLEINEIIQGRKRRVQEKQRLVRELRVVESCVQILHVPFAKGTFQFKEMTQDDAIRSICKLTYQLLSKVVENYSLNQIYASQWIKLYLKNVLDTTAKNQIGADIFLTQLSDQNKSILENKFDREIINNFISSCERSLETPRLLRLLTALCSSQDAPIPSNQTDIIQILMEQSQQNRDKFLMLFRKQKRGDIEVCLNLQKGKYVVLHTIIKQINKIREETLNSNEEDEINKTHATMLSDYNAFLQLIDLLSEACLGRNAECQRIVSEKFELKIIQPIIESTDYPYEIRYRLLKLCLNLYLDKTFQKLVVPSETVIWNQLHNLEARGEMLLDKIDNGSLVYPFKMTKGHIARAFYRMKEFCEDYLVKQRGVMRLEQVDHVQMTQQVLQIILFMVNHGFYTDQTDLNRIARPIVSILDGSNDSIKINGKDHQLGTKRYFPNKELDDSVGVKRLACDILIQIAHLETDQKCSIVLSKLKYDIESSSNQHMKFGQSYNKSHQINRLNTATARIDPDQEIVDEEQEKYNCSIDFNTKVLDTLCEKKGFESQNEGNYICILFDLLLYRYPALTKSVFELLVIYFLRTRTVTSGLLNVQVLESSKSINTLNQIKDQLSQLKQLQSETSFWLTKPNDYGKMKKEQTMKIFCELEKLCEYRSRSSDYSDSEIDNNLHDDYILHDIDPIQPDAENQKLLRDFNLASLAMFFIKQRVDRITINDPQYIELITSCYGFLVGYVRENLPNQIQLYEDLDSIMRDSDKYQKATLLVYEIFRDNKKFLTLNVTKFVRQIVNFSEERLLDSPKKATYLKLLEVFCRFQDKLVRQNQSEIIIQFTQDTARSNVLYLLQPEGARELYEPLAECQVITYDEEPKDGGTTKNKRKNSSQKVQQAASQEGFTDMRVGHQTLNIQIFNVIQLISLVQLCCQGKSEIAEKYTKQYILSFQVCGNMIAKAGDFWPLKISVLKFVYDSYMDTADLAFLHNEAEADDQENEEGEEAGESEVQTLLKIVENLNDDFEKYLSDSIVDHTLHLPTGKTIQMMEIVEEYIFEVAMLFMEITMQKKPTDIGSFDMKFFDIGKNLASLYYKATKNKHKLNVFRLLSYMQTSENNARYLSDVKHPAKKLKNNEELEKLQNQADEEGSDKRPSSAISRGDSSSTKSSSCTNKINEMCYSNYITTKKETEFELMVNWVTLAEQKIDQIMKESNQASNQYSNVRFAPIISALLYLLDAQILTNENQLMGIKLVRKIVEVENAECVTPAADWDSDEWVPYKRMIQLKQDYLVERGCVPFLCKLISDTADPSIREELILVCITLILGGNQFSQNAFVDYMVQEDQKNCFLLTVKEMLTKYFELTKKYLTEKNAKLEMVQKIKKQQQMKHLRQSMIKESENNQDQEEESDDNLLTIEDEDEEEEDAEKKQEDNTESNMSSQEEEKNIMNCIRTLRFLQLLCEGHHRPLQNHLREQKTKDGVRSPYSFDFVAYCSQIMGIYVKNYVNCYSTVLGNQLIEALVEFVQGPCRANQKTLVDTKVIDCCRDLLSQGSVNQDDMAIKGFTGRKKCLLDELKMNAVKLLLSIIEGTVDEEIYEKVSQSLGDFHVILQRMETLYREFVTEELGLSEKATLDRIQNSLKSDSFDGQISEGFDIYDLLNQLGDVIQRDKERLIAFEKNEAYSFFKKNTGKIEVTIDGDIQIVFFIIQPKCRFLTDISKTKFLQAVERETQQDKILGILQAVPGFIDEMDHLEEMTRRIVKLPPQVVFKIRDLSTVLAVAIAFVIVWQYRYEKVLRPDGAFSYEPYIPPYWQFVMKLFGYLQLFSSSFLLVGFFINQKNLVIKEGWRKRIAHNQLTMQGEVRQIKHMRDSSMSNIKVEELEVYQARQFLTIEGPYSSVFLGEDGSFNFHHNAVKFEYYWVSVSNLINCGGFVFAIQYLLFSIQGLLQSPVFYSFHLLDVIERFPTLKDVIRSVTMNIKQLLMTAMLGVILIYLYGVIAFMFIPDLYFDEGVHQGLINKAGDSICMSLLHCFLSTFNYGLRTGGGMGEFLPAETAAEYNSQAYNIRFFFDVSFFLLVITILLNVIFGIIIDTFAELREKSSMQLEDMKNVCYICGLNRQTLDRDTDEGFEVHNLEDHDIWNYVYFLIHLQIKDKSDMNGVESYIKEKFEMQETSWFPLHRCLRIIKEQRKKSDQQSETNKVSELQKALQHKISQAEEGIKNLESILS